MPNDFRFALRMLFKDPAFTAVSLVVLALGIGANTAMFSVINAVLLRPLPYREPERLVLFWERIPQMEFAFIPTSEGGFLDWNERNTVFEGMAGFRNHGVTLTGQGNAERVSAMEAGAELLPLLGVTPVVGRTFRAEECRPGGEAVILISHAFWQRRFAADPQIEGRKILLDGTPYTIVGVLPQNFEFPPPVFLLDNMFDWNPEIFLPFAPRPEQRGQRGVMTLARLKPSVTIEQAQADLQRVAESLIQDFPENNPPGLSAVLSPLHEQAVGQSRTPLLVLLVAVALLLLIACVNVANLLLARAATRFREIAIRMALGASRRQVIRQLLLESLVLSLTGAAAGALLAFLSLQALVQLGEGQIPNLGPVTIDWTVLAFTLAVALATGILFGLAPALQSSRPDLNEALKEGTRGGGASAPGQRFRSLLVGAEVALAVVLLVGAGLLVRSLLQLEQVPLGFTSQGVVTVEIELPALKYAGEEQQRAFFSRALEEAQGLPGVVEAGVVNHLPLAGGRSASNYEIEGRPRQEDRERFQLADIRRASPSYFQTMQIPLLEGRLTSEADGPGSTPVALVNRALAERNWPGASPIGARLTLDDADSPDAVWLQIVGVVENVKHSGLESSSQDALYLSLMQSPQRFGHLAMRTASSGPALINALRTRIAAIDPDVPLEIHGMDFYVRQAGSQRRSPTLLLGIFAALAVLLSLVGLYGVMSFLVNRRTQEFGIRMALGARRWDVVSLVGGQTARLVLAGLAAGIAASLALSRWLSGMLFEVSPADPLTFLAVALIFGIFSVLAASLPARRASRVDPIRALRTE